MLARQAEGRVPAAKQGVRISAARGRAAISAEGKQLRKVKWGVIGVAKIATEKVIPAMQRGEVSEIAAIASRDLGKAQAAAKKLGIPRAYGSYEELLADPEIEAIYNPLPNEEHVPWTLRALAAGKHVLCEKPIALDAEEARQLIDARDRSGKLVAEAFMVRFHPQWRRARELARDGTIGETRAIQTFFSYRLLDPDNVRNRPPGGGGLYDIGCYAILTARYIFGAEPTRVVATIDWDPKFKTDRLASALLEFPGGRQLTFTVGTQLSAHQRVTIMGDAGADRGHDPVQRADRPADRDRHRHRRRSHRRRPPGRDIPRLRPVHAAGRRLLARDRGRVAARVPDRGRDRQHAGHRRPVPLRQERSLGEALSRAAAWARGPASAPLKQVSKRQSNANKR